jgi:hypothetical protein
MSERGEEVDKKGEGGEQRDEERERIVSRETVGCGGEGESAACPVREWSRRKA